MVRMEIMGLNIGNGENGDNGVNIGNGENGVNGVKYRKW